MLLITGIVLIVTNIIVLSGLTYGAVKFQRMYTESYGGLRQFFTPDENGVSPFAETVFQSSKIVGNQVGHSVQGVMNGAFGGMMKGVNAELKEQQLAEHPELALLDYLPKSAKKNGLAEGILATILTRSNQAKIPNNGQPQRIIRRD